MRHPITESYAALRDRLRRAHLLQSTLGLLEWDRQVGLPPGAADLRSEQSSLLAELAHQSFTSAELRSALEALEASDPSPTEDAATVARLVRRDYDRATRLPARFVREKTESHNQAYHAWSRARKENDFAGYAPFLKKNLELAREESSLQGYETNPYDYHIDLHDPGITAATIESLFKRLKDPLLEWVGLILEAARPPRAELFRGFPEPQQERVARLATEAIGFDYRRGRLDRSLHPFCSGDGRDTRLTTRFHPDNPLDSLFSSLHEAGHGLYCQGLPANEAATPLGEAVGMAIHESQSRLWENQVGRSRAFWRFFTPIYRKHFPEQLREAGDEDLYRAVNHVSLNPIRVDSDEVTYNLHIMLRFDLERALFSGDLAVEDLPAEWNRLSGELIGLTPANDAEGVLQDIHWSGGAFGYFPSYTLGNLVAAQLWDKALEILPDLESRIEAGDFRPLLEWLQTAIHRHGRRFDTLELVSLATGQGLSTEPLLRYLKERYVNLHIEQTPA